MSKFSVQSLRVHAIASTLFPPTSLKAAINRLGFVQADPIRSPAAAQDLILRHRVKSYHAGDLERHYPSLDIEEDLFYAYGFVPRQVWRLFHPRNTSQLPKFEKDILATVCKFGQMHPKDLEVHFGGERVVNAWGGYSKATKRALEDLHYRGMLRIVKRDKGIRVYEPAPPLDEPVAPAVRSQKLVMTVANILAPVPERSLRETLARIRHSLPDLADIKMILAQLYQIGELERKTIDGVSYVWPTQSTVEKESQRQVRFLAPFDPVVWDRRRFEHLWGWTYRFEAYTPVAKRVRGYYSMPLLWGDHVIGWANADVSSGCLKIELGFVEKRPMDASFRFELEREIERFESFLKKK